MKKLLNSKKNMIKKKKRLINEQLFKLDEKNKKENQKLNSTF